MHFLLEMGILNRYVSFLEGSHHRLYTLSTSHFNEKKAESPKLFLSGVACLNNDPVGVELLCEAKADPYARNPFGAWDGYTGGNGGLASWGLANFGFILGGS